MQDIKISVLFPTRGRTESLGKAVHSLLDLVSDINTIEVLLGVDLDDDVARNYINNTLIPELDAKGTNVLKVFQFPRLGYKRLNAYCNALAALAQGQWLVFFADDAYMESKDWDLEITKYSNTQQLELLRFDTNHNHPFAVFPVIKRQQFELLGFYSPHTHLDKFLYNIAVNIPNGLINIPARAIHDRADITGNNNDETYQYVKQNYNEGRPHDPNDADSPGNAIYTINAINVIRAYLNTVNEEQLELFDLPDPRRG